MDQKIEFVETGILCDNPNCDWVDETVTHEQLKDWLNVPCPKCGENVLTQQDFDNANRFYFALQIANSLTDEERKELYDIIDFDKIAESGVLANPSDVEILKDSGSLVTFEVSTHKELKVQNIKRV